MNVRSIGLLFFTVAGKFLVVVVKKLLSRGSPFKNGIQVLLIFLGKRYLEFLHTRGKGVQGEISFSAFSFCTSFSTALREKKEKGKKGKGEKVKR